MSDPAKPKAILPPQRQALLELLYKERQEKKSKLAQPIPRRINADPVPLSFAQQRLWFIDQLDQGNLAYNHATAVRVRGRLDVPALKQSLNAIVQRHEALRTNFKVVDDQPMQVIVPALTVPFSMIDLREILPAEREAEAQRLANAEARWSFDLMQDPLLRAAVFRLDDLDHVVVLTLHHIIFDGWSISVFVRELTTYYTAFSMGTSPSLPDLPIQYADFAVWQRQQLRDSMLESQLAYWRQQLSGELPVLQLGADQAALGMQSDQGATQQFSLPTSLAEALKTISRHEKATLFMTLLAAFKILLYRYSGEEDILVGTPTASRLRAVTEPLIGMFVNTLVLRTKLYGSSSFREVLRRVRETSMAAYANQDVPLQLIVEDLHLKRNLSYNPLFQVMFVLQNTPHKPLNFGDLAITHLEISNGAAMFDLSLSMNEDSDGHLFGLLEYNTDLFDADTIARMLRHFRTLLEGAIDEPDRAIATLRLLSHEEQQQMVTWSGLIAAQPAGLCLHQLFEAQVTRTPDIEAVILEAQRLSYQKLNARANQLAHYLLRRGVTAEVRVIICMDRSPDFVIGLLSILKAGGAYIPLDPTNPQERLTFALNDAQAPVVLTQQRFAAAFAESGTAVVCIDTDWGQISQEPTHNPMVGVTPKHLAYGIYTSGSTGFPKGVLITHQNIVNHCLDFAATLELGVGDRILQFAAITFDVATEEIFPALATGTTVVLLPDRLVGPNEDLQQLIEQYRLTLLSLPASYWHEWVRYMSYTHTQPPESVRALVVGGEKVSPELFKSWQSIVQDRIRWINAYGPTETTITASMYEPAVSLEYQHFRSMPIGCPIRNVRFYLLDKHLQFVPPRVPGELYIGGLGLARGYLNRPDLTAENFIPDPFGSESGARLYKTGDRARYLPDGTIEVLGRVDYQVKLRGFRIELDEIVAVLEQHPAVHESAVIIHEDIAAQQRLVAYVVPEYALAKAGPETWTSLDGEQRIGGTAISGDDLDAKELRAFLKQKLPAYMIPAAIEILDALPRTNNGKLDRSALTASNRATRTNSLAQDAPSTETEQIVATIWCQLLGVDTVSLYDDFFELGGHSLLATQLISRVRAAFRIDIPLRVVFETSTLKEFVQVIEQRTSQDTDKLANLLAEIELLSDEEAAALLGNDR
jgi:amino acid adenylation domain-containing protein